MQFIVGRLNVLQGIRGGSQVIHINDGYYYHKHNDRENSIILGLRCVKRRAEGIRCRGRALTSRDGMFFTATQGHNHLPDHHYPQELRFRRQIMDRIRSGDPTPYCQIIREEGQRGGYSIEVRSRLTPGRLRTSMRNQRMLNYPNVPRNLAVLGALLSSPQFHRITSTLDGQDNIFAGVCGVYAEGTISVIFMSRRMMAFLQRQYKVYADGTFRKRPKKPNCCQIFNLSVTWTHRETNTKHTIVVARVFMQKRTEAAYRVLIDFLITILPRWEPQAIMCDFERGQVNAWRSAFPNARIVPCLWHYAVAVFRYSKELGLHPLMQENWVMDAIVRCCCAIPLLPSHLLMTGLVVLGMWARRVGLMTIPTVRSFFEYVEKEWMGRTDYLSVCDAEDRTNNVSESVNSNLGWELRQDRPNIFEVVGSFVRQEDQFMVDIHALSNGRDARRAQRTSCLANDTRIRNLTEDLRNGQTSVFHFLRAASHTLHAPYQHVFER